LKEGPGKTGSTMVSEKGGLSALFLVISAVAFLDNGGCDQFIGLRSAILSESAMSGFRSPSWRDQ
jgi:hypothetical protein